MLSKVWFEKKWIVQLSTRKTSEYILVFYIVLMKQEEILSFLILETVLHIISLHTRNIVTFVKK